MTQALANSFVAKIWSLLTLSQRRSAKVLVGLMLIGMVLETLGVGMVIPALSFLTHAELTKSYPALQPLLQKIGNPSQQALVIGAMLGLVGVYLVKTIFVAFLVWMQMRFGYNLRAELSQRLYKIYLGQQYTFHLQRNSAQLIRNAISEVDVYVGNVIMPALNILTESLVLLGLCGLLFIVEPLGTVIVMVVFGSASWGFYHVTRARLASWGNARQYHDGQRIQHLQQGLGGAKDVKVFGRELEFLSQYDMHNVKSARSGQLQATIQQYPRLWLELLAICGIALMVIIMESQGRAAESVLPTLGMFAAAAFRLMPSFSRLLGGVQSLRYGLPVIDVLYEEVNLVMPSPSSLNASQEFQRSIGLIGVSYTYPGAVQPSLCDVTMSVSRGESVGIIGASGAGKSTLVDILLGLLTPDDGRVLIDGQDIHLNIRSWQDQIGYVPQSIFLTDDSLRRNVAFGLPDDEIDDVAVQRAIQAAQLEGFVANLPDGLGTLVGERGVRLSGGQRQRIGIARALYHDPAVLVLDEATSSLDIATEREVMKAVRALQGAKTVIIIAHRLATVTHCDKLYRLEKGRVVEEGEPNTISLNNVGQAQELASKMH